MSDGGARRVALAGAGYLVVAALVLLVAGWVRPVLALPPLFPRLLRAVLAVGLPVTLVLAWRYPRLGHHGAVRTDEVARSAEDDQR